MQEKLGLIIAAVIVLLIILAGAFMLLRKSKHNLPETTSALPSTQSEESSTHGSIKSLLDAGKDVTCTYTYSDAQGETSGTVFVTGKKMSGDFTTKTSDGKQTENHMIQDDTYIYYWSSAMPQGTKMKIAAVSSPNPSAGSQSSTGQNQGVDLNKDVNYKCSSWTVDNSKFTPPSNVTFTDFSQMMKGIPNQMPQSTPTVNNSSKSVCDQITDPKAKIACESSGY